MVKTDHWRGTRVRDVSLPHSPSWAGSCAGAEKVLADKGYHNQFVLARNARQVDRAVKQETLPVDYCASNAAPDCDDGC